jgi:hypothetical protein
MDPRLKQSSKIIYLDSVPSLTPLWDPPPQRPARLQDYSYLQDFKEGFHVQQALAKLSVEPAQECKGAPQLEQKSLCHHLKSPDPSQPHARQRNTVPQKPSGNGIKCILFSEYQTASKPPGPSGHTDSKGYTDDGLAPKGPPRPGK